MVAILKPGSKKRSYEIVREMNRGAFAIAYEARAAGGARVFLKQYKSPSIKVDWFPGFVTHQDELKRRIGADPAARERCYRFVEFFTDPEFFQVFEFIEGGIDLKACLEKRDDFAWPQLVTFAKVMMFGVKALHDIRVVHTDLKPENLYLIPDRTITVGHKLRVIDLDWAIFADQRAPWDGIEGYTGTPGYQSPEHLRGEVPLPASDVFTCGIMLGEMLGGGHPFAAASDGYAAAAIAGEFEPISLRQNIDKVVDHDFLTSVLNACLDPRSERRPTSAQVADALSGKIFSRPESRAIPELHREKKVALIAKPTPPSLITSAAAGKLVAIYYGDRRLTTVSVDSTLGRIHFRSVDPEAQFLSDPQFRLFRVGDRWTVEHISGAANETLVDGMKLTGPQEVRDGMRIAVGNSGKSIEKFPLHLRLEQ